MIPLFSRNHFVQDNGHTYPRWSASAPIHLYIIHFLVHSDNHVCGIV